ncbi:CG30053 [Drosophila busckii]|uniref:CG30053 n=1 Tax=Drosophila busckii TaxID=30019 RepID=A0A0M4E9D0_DROBS|nr:uncharacterized protein LOC108596436 [Drosophila busckii]ALC41496.1 CG30053 [Drosophila busckii]
MESVEQDVDKFLKHCRKQQLSEVEMHHLYAPLVWQLRWLRLKHWLLWLLLPALLTYLLWNYCSSFAWTLSALGRLLLIQVLPYWNWTPYYNAKCLIEKADVVLQKPQPLDRLETLAENCALCESLDSIPTAANVSYSQLESQYLERGLPVIITDCQQQTDVQTLLDIINEHAPQLLDSEPCDISSNLLLRKLFTVDAALQKISSSTAWYLQWRHCDFQAVKASRRYALRPYYYPAHLEPYYSSWLLMAHKVSRPQKEIYVKGLIFVQQWSGHFEWQLRAKSPCAEDYNCPKLKLRLEAGECAVFTTDLWRLSYGLTQPHQWQSSIASIYEVNWQL